MPATIEAPLPEFAVNTPLEADALVHHLYQELRAIARREYHHGGGPMTLQDYNNLFNIVALRENKLLPADVYDFIFSALASGAVEDDLRLDYTPRIVGQWLGEAEDAEAAIGLGERAGHGRRAVRGGVVHDQAFPVRESLAH